MANLELLKRYTDLDDISQELSSGELDAWGSELAEGVQRDKESRSGWEAQNMSWIRLATQVVEKKSYPWPGAANMKFPLLTIAALNFQARAYPALINGNDLVRPVVIGYDADGSKLSKAVRVSKFMSAQCRWKIPNWEEDMDRGLFILPFAGVMFKKIYFDPVRKTARADLVSPADLIIDYYAKSVNEASRAAHYLTFTKNQVKENQMAGVWRDVELPGPEAKDLANRDPKVQSMSPPSTSDDATVYEFYEVMCFRDLDGDGYAEPYIVTIEKESQKIFRVVARFSFSDGSVILNERNELMRIEPNEFYVRYPFIPDPHSGVYGLGWGALVGPLNDGVNTLTNLLIDAGHVSNLQAGIIGKNVKILGGDLRFKPGEWKIAQFTGDDIGKHIFPLPVREPSVQLLNLLQLLIQYTEKLSSTMDIMSGEMPGQNTKATVVMQAVEQGGKVYSAIHKRLYKALTQEFRLLFRLNKKYLDVQEYVTVLDDKQAVTVEVMQSDFDDASMDIVPAADPSMTSMAQKLAKVQALLEINQVRPLNPDELALRYLDATEQPNIEKLLQVAPPQPPIEMQLKQMELQAKAAIFAQEQQYKYDALQVEMAKVKAQIFQYESIGINQIAMAEGSKTQLDLQKAKILMDHVDGINNHVSDRMELMMKRRQMELDAAHEAAEPPAVEQQEQASGETD